MYVCVQVSKGILKYDFYFLYTSLPFKCFTSIIVCSSLRHLTSTQDDNAGSLRIPGQPNQTLKVEKGEKKREVDGEKNEEKKKGGKKGEGPEEEKEEGEEPGSVPFLPNS